MNKALLKGFEVEWCSHMPIDERGDADFDNATYSYRDFKNHAAAVKFAIKIIPKDYFASARVTEFKLVPFEPGCPPNDRDYIGESKVIEQP